VIVALSAGVVFFADRAFHYRGYLEEQARLGGHRGVWLRDPEAQRRGVAPGATVFLGDSLFENWNLGAVFGATAVNHGVNGDKAAEVRARVPAALALRPRRVVLHAGMNDLDGVVLRGDPVAPVIERIVRELRAAVAEIRAAGADPVLTTLLPVCRRFLLARLSVLPLPTPGRAELGRAAAQASQAVRALAGELGVAILDLEPVLAGPDGARLRRYALPDGIHVSREGDARLGAELHRVLPELVESTR
jgi:lysophospholipase L1-like esterase